MVYLITYDLRQEGRNYDGVYKAIKSAGDWLHFLDSAWLVDSTLSATQIAASIRPEIDANDSFLVIGVRRDCGGWLPQDVWDWIGARV